MNNPPMAPLFKCRHFSTDELFGSWMFALATFPLVPYCLVSIRYNIFDFIIQNRLLLLFLSYLSFAFFLNLASRLISIPMHYSFSSGYRTISCIWLCLPFLCCLSLVHVYSLEDHTQLLTRYVHNNR